MNKKFTALRYFHLAMVVLLVACGALPVEPTATNAPTITATLAPSLTPFSSERVL